MVLIPWLYPPFPVSCPFRFAIALLRSLLPQESRKWLCLLSQEIADYQVEILALMLKFTVEDFRRSTLRKQKTQGHF
jgi:hypothetical protein